MFFFKVKLFEWIKFGLFYVVWFLSYIFFVCLCDNWLRWLYDDVDKGLDKFFISKVLNDFELMLNNKWMLENYLFFW